MARGPGKEVGVTVTGLDQWIDSFSNAAKKVPAAVRYAVNAAANEIRDRARSNVNSSRYNISHNAWGIKAISSKKNPYGSVVGYYADRNDGNTWHIKFYESGAKRKNRGSIEGGRFLRQLHGSADAIAQEYMDKSIAQMLKDVGM